MDIIRDGIVVCNKVVLLLKEHTEKIHTLFTDTYEYISKINGLISDSIYHLHGLEDFKFKKTDEIFSVIHSINTVDDNIENIIGIIRNDIYNAPINKSNSFMIKVETEFSIILAQHRRTATPELYHIVLSIIHQKPLAVVQDNYNLFPNTARIYAHFLQKIFDDNKSDSEIFINALDALEDAKLKSFNLEQIPQTMGLQRFGLIPIRQHLTYSEMLQYISAMMKYRVMGDSVLGGGVVGGGDRNGINRICKRYNIGVLLMHNVANTPIEFRFDHLVNRRLIVKISDNAGVTKDVIQKYDVVRHISEDSKPLVKTTRLGDTSSDNWVIVRTINGVHYDIVKRSTNKAFVDRVERGASPLIHTYQKIKNDCFSKHLVPAIDVKYDTTPTFNPNLGTNITNNLRKYIDIKLKTVPTSVYDIFNMFVGNDIVEIVGNTIIQSYLEFDKKTGCDEMNVTFLSTTNYLILEFVKSVRILLSQSDLTKRIFVQKTPETLVTFLRLFLMRIVLQASQKVFHTQQTLYESLYVKHSLLKTARFIFKYGDKKTTRATT